MSDPRFARLKTDPRFRRIRKQESKVVVDDRFKGVFDEGKKKKGKKSVKGRVDKYGRPLADTHEQDNLRRFYRLENEEEENPDETEVKAPDYARGAALLESSDEDEDTKAPEDDDSDAGGIITLGRDVSRPIPVQGDDELEIDLDEDEFADLDAQAAAYSKTNPQVDEEAPEVDRTRRLAVVNLDWDHVRAIHLHKIFSSLVSPTGSSAMSSKPEKKMGASKVVRGKVLSVRVYPSKFGKERMAREDLEGPPPEVFRKNQADDDEEVNEQNIYETGDGEDYNEDALRKYQLERLRYYYAIVECDSAEAATHIYSELEGTELERSANVFDLSFVPDGMTFDDECRDEASEDLNAPYKGLEFVTDALRHSKVKLTWDDEDPERNQITRRTFSRKEIDENDFKAYLASSTSSSESEGEGPFRNQKNKASRDKLRALLLGGDDDALPEGWGKGDGGDEDNVDMEITFTPGLSEMKEDKDETTLEKYQRKMKEKKKKRKEEKKDKLGEGKEDEHVDSLKDDFFAESSDVEEADDEGDEPVQRQKGKKSEGKQKLSASPDAASHTVSATEELTLIVSSDNPNDEQKHFDMKAVLKAEKSKGKNRRRKKSKGGEEENELQEDFTIDIQDDRFQALHEDHSFAIDPSNPHYKKTKSMSALLEERSKRQRNHTSDPNSGHAVLKGKEKSTESDLKSLVERVKRKSSAVEQSGAGKRRKL